MHLLGQVFGLHANADISKDQQEANSMLDSLLATQGSAAEGGGAAGRSREEVLAELAADIDQKIPPPFDIEAARFK
jgi:dynein heavy chain